MCSKLLRVCSLGLLLLVLLYFLNAFAQFIGPIVQNNGYGVIVISLIFAFIFVLLQPVKSIYKALFIAFILYFSWGVILQSIPYSDFSGFYKGALKLSQTGDFRHLHGSKSTTTTLYYAIFFLIFGKGLLTAYLASSLAWMLGCLCLYKSLINFNINEDHAALATIITAFSPSTIAYATVVSSESIFFLLASLALYFCSHYLL